MPDKVIKEQVEKIKFYLNHKTPRETLSYCRFFVKHLKLLQSEDRQAFLTYFLNLLKGEVYTLNSLTKIHLLQFATYLEELPKQDVTLGIVNALSTEGDESEDRNFIDVMEAVYLGLPKDYSKSVLEYVEKYRPKLVKVIAQFLPF